MSEERKKVAQRFADRLGRLEARTHKGPVHWLAHHLHNALEHLPLAVRRVDFLAILFLQMADLKNVLGALVEQADDLRVERVNGFAMFRDVHAASSIVSG